MLALYPKKEMCLLTGGNGCEFTFFRIRNIWMKNQTLSIKFHNTISLYCHDLILNKTFLNAIKIGIKSRSAIMIIQMVV
ncbi:MAG: hypothetical protein C0403_02820 [Desulfobacterium sp.]|nr:hypothetical protein [Desulfobacterium sp.]